MVFHSTVGGKNVVVFYFLSTLQVSDARKSAEQSSTAHKTHYPSSSNMFLPKKIADIFETELTKAAKSNTRSSAAPNPVKRVVTNFFRDKSVKMACMVSSPFILFWGVGSIFHVQLDYLVKVNCCFIFIPIMPLPIPRKRIPWIRGTRFSFGSFQFLSRLLLKVVTPATAKELVVSEANAKLSGRIFQ